MIYLYELKCIKGFASYLIEGKSYKIIEELHKMYYVLAEDGVVRAFNRDRFTDLNS